MRLSTKGEYGLLAIIDVALHSYQGPVQSFQISERQAIPKQYLDQLLLLLKRGGLIESSRGRQGGYVLARPASTITILDIVTVLEGSIENVNFIDKDSRSANPAREILRTLWGNIFTCASEILGNRTLEEICEQQRRMEKQIQIMYYI
jgi:Rrf2 family transcriptional regulator, cysteine metabolism repressor